MNLGRILVPSGVALATAGVIGWKWYRSTDGPRGTIALCGDSYVAGLGPAIASPPVLKQGPDLDFWADGVPGSNSAAWAEAMEASQGKHARRWLVFSLGTNDAGRASDAIARDIDRIARVTSAHGSGLAWIEPPRAVLDKVPTAEAAWNLWRRRVGEGRCFRTDSHVEVKLGPDGLHPLSYRPWAEALWAWLAVLTA